MASYNYVSFVGNLTRDPESRNIGTSKVASFGIAVNERKRDPTGTWVDSPLFLNCECWDHESGRKTASIVMEFCRKGSQILIVGKLKEDTWNDKNTGEKRSKIIVVANEVILTGTKKIDESARQDRTSPQPQTDEEPPPF